MHTCIFLHRHVTTSTSIYSSLQNILTPLNVVYYKYYKKAIVILSFCKMKFHQNILKTCAINLAKFKSDPCS